MCSETCKYSRKNSEKLEKDWVCSSHLQRVAAVLLSVSGLIEKRLRDRRRLLPIREVILIVLIEIE